MTDFWQWLDLWLTNPWTWIPGGVVALITFTMSMYFHHLENVEPEQNPDLQIERAILNMDLNAVITYTCKWTNVFHVPPRYRVIAWRIEGTDEWHLLDEADHPLLKDLT